MNKQIWQTGLSIYNTTNENNQKILSLLVNLWQKFKTPSIVPIHITKVIRGHLLYKTLLYYRKEKTRVIYKLKNYARCCSYMRNFES